MIYNNLIYILIVILLFTTTSVPESPSLAFLQAFAAWLVKGYFYYRATVAAGRPGQIRNSRQYFNFERKFSILAIVSFAVDVYFLDCKYYLSFLPLADHLPVLVDAAGLGLFFLYLTVMWGAARKSYQVIFGRQYSSRSFLVSNIKNNLPIVLPWLLLSLFVDLFQLIPSPLLKRLPASEWSEVVVFIVFFIFLAVTFPALIRRLWGCTPMPAGPARSHIEQFCARQNFTYSDIMYWPLFEGQALTAGIMGIYKKLRYLLITPALLNTLTPDEVEAVMAHEIGHAKKYHLQLYLFLFLGFAILVSLVADPILYLILSSDIFYRIASFTGSSPESGLTFWGTAPLFVIMIVYFRYIFGFFMRNFERQADLYVFKAIGNSDSLAGSLEKIGWLSGNIRDLPSWHHFGISQRVEFLEKCRKAPALIRKHDIKVYGFLVLYVLLLAGAVGLLQKMPMDHLRVHSKNKFVEAVVRHKAVREPENPVWHRLLGDILQERKMAAGAREEYERALGLNPADPETMNNLAWLLITSTDKKLRAPERALVLAQNAAEALPEGFVIDTLATAYWANGQRENAVAVAREAMAIDPANYGYYRKQINRFLNHDYNDNNLIFEEKIE